VSYASSTLGMLALAALLSPSARADDESAQPMDATLNADNPQPASFDNTIVALERTGQVLNRVSSSFFNLAASNTDPAILQLETEIAPKLAAHRDAIYLNTNLFARIDTLYRERAALQLDGESRQLLERYHTEFVRAGARLADPEQQ
jgi:peptidyl-dipeptidase Dcp